MSRALIREVRNNLRDALRMLRSKQYHLADDSIRSAMMFLNDLEGRDARVGVFSNRDRHRRRSRRR